MLKRHKRIGEILTNTNVGVNLINKEKMEIKNV